MLRIFLIAILIKIAFVNCAVLNRKYDVIVVGLGSAGATASSVLAKAGRRVLALEAQNRTGGRVNTVPFGDGVVELGAEWIHGINNSFTYETARNASINILVQEFEMVAYYSNGTSFDNKLLEEIFSILGTAEYTGDVPPQPLGEYITRQMKKFLETHYPDLLNDTDSINEILDFMNRAECGPDGTNDWNDVTTASKYERLGGPQDASWHRFGYKTFFEILLNTYKNGPGLPNLNIQLNSEVTKISYPEGAQSGLVRVKTLDGATYEADSVVVTVSLGVLQERYNTLFYPPLPEDKKTVIDKMSFGIIDKIILYFDEVWWPEKMTDFSFVWRAEERRTIKEDENWLLKLFGISLSMGASNAFEYWVHGDAAKMMENMSDDVVQEKIMKITRMFMGKNRTIPDPVSMVRSLWYSNPYTRGSYSFDNNWAPQHPHAREILARPIVDSNGGLRILFAGEATSPTHYSTVHGAAETGYREAMRLLNK